MSWYGAHANITREEAVRVLPPAACRHCVYWFRVAAGSAPDTWWLGNDPRCGRCGVDRAALLRQWQGVRRAADGTLVVPLSGAQTPNQAAQQTPPPDTFLGWLRSPWRRAAERGRSAEDKGQ